MVEGHLGISGAHFLAMAGKLYLGHDRHALVLRVSHQLPELLLGVVAAKTVLAVAIGAHVAHVLPIGMRRRVPPVFPHLTGAPRTHLGQSRVGFDLHAPSSSVGEVEMQDVEAVMAHHVDLAIQLVDGQKMAAHIDHHATPRQRARLGRLGGMGVAQQGGTKGKEGKE